MALPLAVVAGTDVVGTVLLVDGNECDVGNSKNSLVRLDALTRKRPRILDKPGPEWPCRGDTANVRPCGQLTILARALLLFRFSRFALPEGHHRDRFHT